MKTFQYAMRFLLRARSYTLINLLGLAFSLACCIVLLRYIHREYTVDVHCVDRNEVYAVRVDMEGNSYWGAYSVYQDSILIAPELIDVTCRFTPLDNDYLISDGHRYPCAALATDSTFFRLFSFRTVQGEQDLRSFIGYTDRGLCIQTVRQRESHRQNHPLFQWKGFCGQGSDCQAREQGLAEF